MKFHYENQFIEEATAKQLTLTQLQYDGAVNLPIIHHSHLIRLPFPVPHCQMYFHIYKKKNKKTNILVTFL